jgi:hypothetical protein
MRINDVRVEIYRSFLDEGRAPMPYEVAARLRMPVEEVKTALEELHQTGVIALAPGTHNVWLAHPFSAMDAPFRVQAKGRRWDAICVWDAFGVLALMDADGTVSTACPDCGEDLSVEISGGRVTSADADVVHYGVPASRWYEDVGYT